MALRGGRRAVWAAVAAIAAVAAVVAGVLLATGGPDGGRGEDGAAVADVTRAEPEESMAPTAEPVPPDTTPAETPEVTPQATGLKEQALPEAGPGDARPTLPPGATGCDHNYGEPAQCVPWTFPDGIAEYADKCLWLELNGFTGDLRVVGADRQRLDPDGNDIACDG